MTLFQQYDNKVLPIFLVNLCLLYGFYILNDVLSPLGIYLYVPVLFIVVPALFLGFKSGMLVILLTGLIWEAGLPTRAFMVPVVWMAVGALMHEIRFRYRNLDGFAIMMLCVVSNFILFLLSAFFFPSTILDASQYVMRIIVDMFFSSIFVMLSAAFIVGLHCSIFYFFGINLSIKESS